MTIEDAIRPKAEFILKGIKNTLADAMGVEFRELSRKRIVADMPIGNNTVQPVRILHGGASVALAETVTSIAGWLNLEDENLTTVGMEINANHIRPVKEGGTVTAVATPIHLGRRSQVWQTHITDQNDKLVCISRCTVAIVPLETV